MRTGRSPIPARPTYLSTTRIDCPLLFSSNKQLQILRGSAAPSRRKRSKSTRLIDTPALTTSWLGLDGLTMQSAFQINSDTPSNFSRCCCRRGTEHPLITLGKPNTAPSGKGCCQRGTLPSFMPRHRAAKGLPGTGRNGSGSMNTAFLLMAQYGGKAIIPVDEMCREYFSHLNPTKLVQNISAGEIAIPLVRIEASQKCAKGVHLLELAKYLDARVEAARKEMTAPTT